MSKELEALEHIYYGSQGYGETDKYYKYLKEYLESIDNANPSEALEFLERIDKEYGTIECDDFDNCFNTIKQALLKAQEPKQYLKWEDLEFKEEEQTMKVLLNGERYILKAYKDYIIDISVVELEKTDGTFLFYINQCNFQFFNDLHLERVEE